MDLRSMPNLGEKAPDFELPDDRGRMVHLSEVTRDAVTILLFYPADFGMICSIQMEEIRGMYQDFQTFGVPVFRYLPTASVRMRPGRNRCATVPVADGRGRKGDRTVPYVLRRRILAEGSACRAAFI